MNQHDQQTAFENLVTQMRETLLKKGNDYSGKDDRLKNFKQVGHITNAGAEQACLTLIAVKVSRLGQLYASGAKPENESVKDNLLDLCCYSVLLHMINAEKESV